MNKKINLLLALTFTSSIFVYNMSNGHHINQNNEAISNDNSSNKIDWNIVQSSVQSFNLSSMPDFNSANNGQNTADYQKALDLSKEASLNYASDLEQNNNGLNKMHSDLNKLSKNNKPLLKNNKNYSLTANNAQWDYTKLLSTNTMAHANIFSNNFNANDPSDEVKKMLAETNFDIFISNLNIADVTITTMAAICAVASVGFWAAAWFFGITVPWAIAADVASVTLGITSAAMTVYLYTLPGKKSIFDCMSWALNLRTLAGIYKDVFYPLAAGIDTVATSESWAVPALLALLAIGAGVMEWLTYLKV